MYSNTKNNSGFTLVEILVVLFIIGIISLIVFPRIQVDSPTKKLKYEIRRFTGFVHYIRNTSATMNRLHKLYIDLDEGQYWVVYLDDKGEEIKLADNFVPEGQLKEGVSFKEIQKSGKLTATEGRTSIIFYASGEIEPAEIQFKNTENQIFYLRIHPLTGRCKVWQADGV